MKKLLPLTLLFAVVGLTAPLAAQSPTPKTDREKLGYALGMDVVKGLKDQSIDYDPVFFTAAIKDSLAGGQTAMTADQGKEVIKDFIEKMRAKQLASMPPEQRAAIEAQMKAQQEAQAKSADPAAAAKNKEAGTAFLAANKGKSGVQTLTDGLQYKIVAEGSGPSPKATDTVTVKYKGSLIDGTVFDASDKHPPGTVSFPVNGVIPGWTEALQKMKVGSKWQLFIPSNLAYGSQGMGPDIGPDSTLIFDVELVSIGK